MSRQLQTELEINAPSPPNLRIKGDPHNIIIVLLVVIIIMQAIAIGILLEKLNNQEQQLLQMQLVEENLLTKVGSLEGQIEFIVEMYSVEDAQEE